MGASGGTPASSPSRRMGDIAEIASLPLAIGAAVAIGWFAGRWVGRTFFPAHAEAWATGGVLYGLAGGFYHAVKVIRAAIRRADRARAARPPSPLRTYLPPTPADRDATPPRPSRAADPGGRGADRPG